MEGGILARVRPVLDNGKEVPSHSTRAHAYMSIRKNASLLKLMAPSNTSGAKKVKSG
jgi:hypothetical protein